MVTLEKRWGRGILRQQEEIEDYIWLNYAKAIKTLKFENDRSILERAHEFLVRTGVIDAE